MRLTRVRPSSRDTPCAVAQLPSLNTAHEVCCVEQEEILFQSVGELARAPAEKRKKARASQLGGVRAGQGACGVLLVPFVLLVTPELTLARDRETRGICCRPDPGP